jgi:hypothetical protein
MAPGGDPRGVLEWDIEPAEVRQEAEVIDVRLAVVAVVVVPTRRAREEARTLIETNGVGRHPHLLRQLADPHPHEQTLDRHECQPLGASPGFPLDIGAASRSTVPRMAVTPETGYLVIADLTGYTAYLSSAEIEHAPTIAGDLLETIVGRLEPPFRLAKFEGDAAFLFVEDGRAEPSLLLDAIEACYVAFHRRLRSIEQATSCDCVACSRAPRLDLKFFVHHGQYVRTRIAGHDELAGSSIIVVHRLLKGATAEHAHAPDGSAVGFALFTGDALDALGSSAGSLELVAGAETIDHLGTIETHTLDLEARWQTEGRVRRLDIGNGNAVVDLQAEIDADISEVWAHLTSPSLRPTWEGPIVISEDAVTGRRGIGTTTQCVTGRLSTLEEIVDWQPFEHVGYRIAVPGIGSVDSSYDLATEGGRTTVRLRWAPSAANTVAPGRADRIRREKRVALDRLATRLDRGRESPATVAQELGVEVGA